MAVFILLPLRVKTIDELNLFLILADTANDEMLVLTEDELIDTCEAFLRFI